MESFFVLIPKRLVIVKLKKIMKGGKPNEPENKAGLRLQQFQLERGIIGENTPPEKIPKKSRAKKQAKVVKKEK